MLLPVSFMREILSSLRSSYTLVPATSLNSFRRWESGAVAIWLICIKIEIMNKIEYSAVQRTAKICLKKYRSHLENF